MSKKLLVVLGMHRSGTSALTRGLTVLGVDLGENLLGADEQVNAKGFWEDRDILQLNIDIQNALGLRWDNLTPISEEDCQRNIVREFIPRAIQLLNRKMAKSSLFGLKDPRISVLLPFWKQVFSLLGITVHYLISCRNPLSIVDSLAKRDGFLPEHSLQLWQNYMMASLTYTEGESRLVVDFDLLLKDPEEQLNRIAQKLRLPFSTDSAELLEFKSGFLDKSLCHTSYDLSDLELNSHVTPEQIELYVLLSDLARNSGGLDYFTHQHKFEGILNKYKALQGALALAGMQQRELLRLQRLPLKAPLQASLYLDKGEGFNEEAVLRHDLGSSSGHVSLRFDVNQQCSSLYALRFDPVGEPCVIKWQRLVLITENGRIEVGSVIDSNAFYYCDGSYYFSTYDPQLFIPMENIGGDVLQIVEVDFELIAVAEKALDLCCEMQRRQLEIIDEQHVEELRRCSQQLDEAIQAFSTNEENWRQERNAFLHSRSWRLTQPFRTVTSWFRGGDK